MPDNKRILVENLINHYEPGTQVTDAYYDSISQKYGNYNNLVTNLIRHYEPEAQVTPDYLSGIYRKYNIGKSNQLEQVQVQQALAPESKTEVPMSYTWSDPEPEITELQSPVYSTGGTYDAETQDWVIHGDEYNRQILAEKPTSYEKEPAIQKSQALGSEIVSIYENVRETDQTRAYDTYLEDYLSYLANANPERYNDDFVKYGGGFPLLERERFNLFASSLAYEGKKLQNDAEILDARGFFDYVEKVTEYPEIFQDNPEAHQAVQEYNAYVDRWDRLEKANRQLLTDFPDIAEKFKTQEYLNRYIEITKGGFVDVEQMTAAEKKEIEQLTKDLRDKGLVDPLHYLITEHQAIIWNRVIDAGISLMSSLKSLDELASQGFGAVTGIGPMKGIDPMKGYGISDDIMDKVEILADEYIKPMEAERPLMAGGGKVNWYNLPANVVGTGTDMALLLAPVGPAATGLKTIGMGSKMARGTALFASSYANMYHDYYKQALDAGYSRDQAVRYGATTTSIVSSLEFVSPNKGIIKALSSGFGKKSMLKEIGDNVIKKGFGYKEALNGTFKWMKENMKEVGQEVSQTYAERMTNGFSNLVMQLDNNMQLNTSVTRNELIETGLLTFITTGLFQVGTLPKGSAARNGYLYQASLIRPEFEQHLTTLVGEGKISQDRAREILEEVDAVAEATKTIPDDVQSDAARSEIAPLLAEKKANEEKMNDADPVFQPMYEAKNQQKNNEINEILNRYKITEDIRDAERITQQTEEARREEGPVREEEGRVRVRDVEEGRRPTGEEIREPTVEEQAEVEREKTRQVHQDIDEITQAETPVQEAPERPILERIIEVEEGSSPYELGKEFARTKDQYTPEQQREIIDALKFKQEAFKNQQAEKIVAEEKQLGERKEKVKADIAQAIDDFAYGMGLFAKAEGKERPDPVKALGQLAFKLGEFGAISAEQVMQKIKQYVSGYVTNKDDLDKVLKYIDDKREEILTEVGIKERRVKPEVQRQVEEETRQKVRMSQEFKNLRKKLKTQEARTEDIVDFIRTAKPENLSKGEINKLITRVRDVTAMKTEPGRQRALKKAVDEVEQVFKQRQVKNIQERVDKTLKKGEQIKKQPTLTEEGLDVVKSVSDAVKMDTPKSANSKAQINREIEALEERKMDLVDDAEIAEVDNQIQALENKLDILDRYSGLESRPIEELDVVEDMLKEDINAQLQEARDVRAKEKKRIEKMNEEAADLLYGTEARKAELAGRAIKARDIEKEQKKARRPLKVFMAAFETLPGIFKRFDQSFRKGEDIKHENTLFGKMMTNIRKGTRKATEVKEQMQKRLTDKTREMFGSERAMRNLLNDKAIIVVKPPTKDFEVRKMKLGTLAHIYASWNSPSNKKYVEKIGVTEDTINQIEQVIRENPKFGKALEFSNWLINDFFPDYFQPANEIFKRKTGRELPQLDSYLPINAKAWKTKGEALDLAAVDVFKSFTKERQGGQYDLSKNDIFDTATKYINDYSNFIGLSEAIADVQSVFKSKIVENAIARTGNSPYVEAMFEALNTGYNGRPKQPTTLAGKFLNNKALNFVRRRFVQTKILANISLFPKQFTSFVTAFDPEYGDPAGVAKEMVTLPFDKQKKEVTSILKDSPLFRNRNIADIESLAQGKNRIRMNMFGESGPAKAAGTLLTFLWNPTQVGDRVTIAAAGMPVISYNYKARLKELKRQGITGQEAKGIAAEHAMNVFEKFMNETQQSSLFTDLSSFQRGGGRNFTFFMNSVMAYTRKLFGHNREMARGYANKKAKLKKQNPEMSDMQLAIKAMSGIKPKNVWGSFIYGSMLPTLWSLVATGGKSIAALFSDDEEERTEALDNLKFDASLGWTKGLFGVGFLLDYVRNEASGNYYGKRSDNIMRTMDDIFEFSDDAVRVIRYLSKEDLTTSQEKSLKDGLFKLSNKAVSFTFGLPEEQMKRIYQATIAGDYEEGLAKILRIYGLPKESIDFWVQRMKEADAKKEGKEFNMDELEDIDFEDIDFEDIEFDEAEFEDIEKEFEDIELRKGAVWNYKDGKQITFKPGGQWQIIEDWKGMPSHEQGGVDVKISENNVETLREGAVFPDEKKKKKATRKTSPAPPMTDVDIFPIAKKGMKWNYKDGAEIEFKAGGQWEIIEDWKGLPSHEDGGVDVEITGNDVETLGKGKLYAQEGLVVNKSDEFNIEIPENLKGAIEGDPELKYLKQYNTQLTPEESKEFYNWGLQNYGSVENMLYEMGTYDLQGAWKSGDVFDVDERGHGTDKWKKPSHRTFSTESIYHSKENPGGRWVNTAAGAQFHPSKTTLDLYGQQQMMEYFKEHEPDVRLMYLNPT